MKVHYYTSVSGKNFIMDYLDNLPEKEQTRGLRIIDLIEDEGVYALSVLNTRQLKTKLWEIKFNHNRIMYVVVDSDNIYLLHACKKQKGKTERVDLQTAIKRAKELEYLIGKKIL